MTYEHRIGPRGRDDDLTRALRRLYAAPADERYWSTLEQRILARIDAAEEWWQPLAGWARLGIIAAAGALAVASLAFSRARVAQERMAYRTIVETPRTIPLQIATQAAESGSREAILRFVIEP